MNDVATFFRDHKNDSGTTYEFVFNSPRSYRVAVYARRGFDSEEITRAREWSQKIKDLLHERLKSQGGGGWIVGAQEDEGRRTVTVLRVGPEMQELASQYLVLAPGQPARWVDANGAAAKFRPGAHVIVPVEQTAQAHLNDFIGYLRWLSPDLEAIVLNAIRRPSLDARLNRLETEVFHRTTDEDLAESGSGSLGRMTGWIRRMMRARAVRVAVGVLAVLLIGGGAYLSGHKLWGQAGKGTPSLSSTPDTAGATDAGSTMEPVPTATANGDFVDEARTLIQKVRQSEDPLLRLVDDQHFATLGEPWSSKTIADELRPPAAVGKETGNRPVLWGLLKLQLLKLNPSPRKTEFLERWEEITATKSAYLDIPSETVKSDVRGERLLAALACRLGYSTPPAPVLKATPEDKSPVVTFPGDCASLTNTDIERGLTGLIAFVEQRK